MEESFSNETHSFTPCKALGNARLLGRHIRVPYNLRKGRDEPPVLSNGVYSGIDKEKGALSEKEEAGK